MKPWMKWALALAAIVLTAGVFLVFRDRRLLEMAFADERLARAGHLKAKAASHQRKVRAAKSAAKSTKHLAAAGRYSDEARRIEDEAREHAVKIAAASPNDERARRFNARHKLHPPPAS